MENQSVIMQFLRTGALGPITIGVEVDKIVDLFGPPDRYDSVEEFYQIHEKARKAGGFDKSSIYYGVLELLFSYETNRIEFFKVYYEQTRVRKVPGNLDDGWVSRFDGMSKEEFRKALVSYGISSKRVLNPKFDSYVTVIWIQESEIKINFNEENDADELLVISKLGQSSSGRSACIKLKCIDFS